MVRCEKMNEESPKIVIGLENIDGILLWVITFLSEKRNEVITVNDLLFECCTTIINNSDNNKLILETLSTLSQGGYIDYDDISKNGNIQILPNGLFLFRKLKEKFDDLMVKHGSELINNILIKELPKELPIHHELQVLNDSSKKSENLVRFKRSSMSFILRSAIRLTVWGVREISGTRNMVC